MPNEKHIDKAEGEPTPLLNAVVLAILMALLGVTIAAALIDLGGWGLAVAMAVASLKAVLVVAYFMHLRYSDRLTRVFAAAGGVWLAVLLVLVFVEVMTR